ncbi:hypothetical protein [Nocardiopsis coralliicola]
MRPDDPAEHRRRAGGPNTRHPAGIRVVAGVLGAAALVLGPVGYLQALSAADTTTGEWLTLGFAVSIGLPLLAAAVTTVAGDRRAALWCLALLAWPPIYIAGIHLVL